MKKMLVFCLCVLLHGSLFSQTPLIEIKNLPGLKKSANGQMVQLVSLEIDNVASAAEGKATLGNQTQKLLLRPKERAVVLFEVPEVKKEKVAQIKILAGNINTTQKFKIVPIKRWQVNLVQHTHTDIGYTRSQTEILAEELRYIDYALDYCDATDNYPDDAKFRWTCEASMPLSEYLKVRPKAQIERLKKRISEGRIEISGMYFNFDELPDEQMYAASLYPLKQLKAEGLDCKVAIQDDVNGIGWCFSDFFPTMGIRYFSIGSNADRALIPFDKPTVFWWESPSGNKMLVHRAEHYHTGNHWGIDKGDFNVFEKRMLMYLANLQAKNYPFDIVSIQYSGYFIDNSPPSTHGPEMIRMWNEKYLWPKLRSASTFEFFDTIEKKYGSTLQTIRAAWPDWWIDGFGSGAMETAVNRDAQANIIASQAGLSMAKLLGAGMPVVVSEKIRDANVALLFYGEHTYGYHASISDPYGLHTMEHRYLKASYAWEAHRRTSPITETAMGLLQTYIPRANVPSLAVFNPHNWEYSGVVEVYIDHQILPHNRKFKITDAGGNALPAQPSERQSDGTYWNLWVDKVPAFGVKQYLIKVEDEEPSAAADIKTLSGNIIENDWYKVTLDPARGSISSWYDKQLNKELVTPGSQWQLGEFIYELADSRRAMSRHQMPEFKRKGVDSIAFEAFVAGDIWDTWRFRGQTSAGIGKKNYMFELRLFKTSKRIDLAYRLRKAAVTDPEAVYIAMPFELSDGKIYFDVQGGTIQAGVDQIKGSVTDWNMVQNFASVRNGSSQVVVSSHEMPLMQFGAINTGRYQAGALPQSTNIYSWPMNNYWTTNFNAFQQGEMEWKYNLTSSADNSNGFATRFGWNCRVPALARVFPASNSGGSDLVSRSLLEIGPGNLLLVNAYPLVNENGIILQLRELDGKEATLGIKSQNTLKISECDAIGTDLKKQEIVFAPFAHKFVKISW